jgi:hypothetical protein
VDSSLVTLLANLGTGGVVVVLIILGYLVPKPTHSRALEDSAHKDEEIAKLQEALALERQRSNDATQAATVTNQLIGALTTLATEHRAAEKHEHQDAAGKAEARALPPGLDLTGKDLGP